MKLEKENANIEELEELGRGSLPRAAKDGDVVTGSVMAGQISGLINKEQTCKEIVEDLINGAKSLIKDLED